MKVGFLIGLGIVIVLVGWQGVSVIGDRLAGTGTESRPVSELVETAYLSGLRVADEVRSSLKQPIPLEAAD